MALAQHRVIQVGETPYAHEREAIDFVTKELPNSDPFLAWPLVELLDPSTGRLYEIDMLVLGYSALYLVEIKSGPGTYTGDGVDWTRIVPGERAHTIDCPYRLANHKAKVLASLLQRKLARAPWVFPLVFLSHETAKDQLRADGRTGVVTRATVKRALTHHDFPNADRNWRGDPIDRPLMREVSEALEACGVRPRKGRLQVGGYDLCEIVQEGDAFQDRVARHRATPSITQRARIYLVPQQTSVERRQALRRAADREANLLHELREHAGILRFNDYFEDAPLGPTVMLDAFEDGVRLDTFVRKEHDQLSFADRVTIIEQIARALAFCHRKEVLHGGLNPECVLVRRRAQGFETRLFNFQLALADGRVAPTAHISAWSAQPALAYQPPEVREDPSNRRRESDIFSLGAVAYFVLTGQPPAPDALALDDRLTSQGALDPRAVNDAIPPGVANAIREATHVSWTGRIDDAGFWIEELLEAATAPEPTARPTYVDPLVAKKDDRLSADLVARGVLGQGASARVLRVHSDRHDGEFALKVSLSAEHDERIRAEARALARFRHPRIVEKIEDLELGGRACILLALAGTMTLQHHLQEEGPVVLDYAQRWGDDLLSAVEYLDEEEITHRDIKPANLGIGSSGKKANHLTLFDFSLVLADPASLGAGTAAYRDPFLRPPRTWDTAADLYSAAVTLHEMLTGVRPSYSGAAVDPSSTLVLAAERFDAGIRDRLVRFFERALARDASLRFRGAREMRHAWGDCFRDTSVHPAPARQEPAPAPVDRPPFTDDELRAVSPDAPLEVLPLSPRAKNALDRAGVVRARDLAKLPDNRLSAIRGVGRLVAREIHDFRTAWMKLSAAGDLATAPFFAGYRGEDLALALTPLPPATVSVLADAGLHSLAALAVAPDEHVVNLAASRAFDIAAVRKLLDDENRAAEARAHPTTLEGFVDALFRSKPKKKQVPQVVRIFFGVEATPAGRRLPIGATAEDAAAAYKPGSTGANVFVQLKAAREHWLTLPATAEIVPHAREVLAEAGGVVSLVEAAERLLQRLPHDRARPTTDLRADAAALLRLAREVDREALDLTRIGSETPWLSASPAHAAAARALGDAADKLAHRTPLASAPETQAALLAVAADTPLATLPVERLAAIAASASKRAACSTRLEMYPRGMPAARAIELTASVLTGKLAPADVVSRVRDRYPEAAELPERPALDDLLRPYGLLFSDALGEYKRPGEEDRSRHAVTRYPNSTSITSISDVATPEARDFDERLVYAVEKRQLRLVLVRSDLMSKAVARLGERLRVAPKRLDKLLLAAMERRAAADEIDFDVVHETDLHGPTGDDWTRLQSLAKDAAGEVEAALFPAREPLVLSHFGLVERYGLQRFFDALAAAARRDDCEAIFLVVPTHDDASDVALRGVTIPGLLPAQRVRASRDWVRNGGSDAV